ncbi:hypothetical protein SAMN05443248_0939 [Bradyrhizobium erythrophlei]|uniref:Uncharacterized protein n=1 Tax=Bradyrhizobium erythrophlei TaxID=1437360 RepID=A0A1M5IE17_9BRAD|nr:hypothetical protein SAMN05443248_0939 [Bradyrhizobium erythrophlei]
MRARQFFERLSPTFLLRAMPCKSGWLALSGMAWALTQDEHDYDHVIL